MRFFMTWPDFVRFLLAVWVLAYALFIGAAIGFALAQLFLH